jgi:hypothetical protein
MPVKPVAALAKKQRLVPIFPDWLRRFDHKRLTRSRIDPLVWLQLLGSQRFYGASGRGLIEEVYWTGG